MAFHILLGFSMYILCQLYILAITFFFSRHYDVKACIFVTHELSHRDVLLDSLFTLPYKFKSNLHVQLLNTKLKKKIIIIKKESKKEIHKGQPTFRYFIDIPTQQSRHRFKPNHTWCARQVFYLYCKYALTSNLFNITYQSIFNI